MMNTNTNTNIDNTTQPMGIACGDYNIEFELNADYIKVKCVQPNWTRGGYYKSYEAPYGRSFEKNLRNVILRAKKEADHFFRERHNRLEIALRVIAEFTPKMALVA
jgi:hypothetical protein